MSVLLDGKTLSAKIKSELKEQVAEYKLKTGKEITLAVILAGENPASKVYVRNKIKACEFVGVKSLAFYLPDDCGEEKIIETVKSVSADDNVDGVLVQLPLPNGVNESKVLSFIPTEKDVDGFKPENLGNLAMNKEAVIACTPKGIMRLLSEYEIPLKGKNAVVVGRSNIVGKPVAMLLLNADCTVTVCHSKTRDLKKICSDADILVAAIGKPRFITADMIKEGAAVIDVGINRTETGLLGDVDFDGAKGKAAFITPVPGGVGPMTIAMLLTNTLECAKRRNRGF
ncbi:MAG TPA: bifunctional methylenetetrahydrofolate dehydrogenase/methenyltetrahydrofolate cyclohydrolase FolD [Clostridiales bacterium]|nr:bifunctional methylenetetrahydrofolate dehydrogenase/methenyltetrahydrofolate cyclohydrolase FolD [Clostridiales bacterium]